MYDEERPRHGNKLVSFTLAGFLIASIIVFSVTVIPEIAPSVFPAFKTGTVAMQMTIAASSPSVVSLEGVHLFVTIESVELHKLGVAGGMSVQALNRPAVIESLPIYETALFLGEADVPVGDYSFASIRFGSTSYVVDDLNFTTQVPARDIAAPAVFAVLEARTTTVTWHVSFDAYALAHDQRFQPVVLITTAEPSPALRPGNALRPIASSGPTSLNPGQNMTFVFEIKPGEVVENYLLKVEESPKVNETVTVDVPESGEFWSDLSGTVWLLGGNMTAGLYHVITDISGETGTPATITVSLFEIPHITGTGSSVSFSGYSPSMSQAGVNQIALYFDEGGSYKFYLLLGKGNYGFSVDYGSIAAVTRNQTITLSVEKGLHTIQIVPDYLNIKADTAWTIIGASAPSGTVSSLTTSSVLGVVLLVVAILLNVFRYSYGRLLVRREDMIGRRQHRSQYHGRIC
jgi:hypothetical protein